MSLQTASFRHAIFVTFSHPHTAAALRTVVEAVPEVHVLGVIEPMSAMQRLLTPHDTTEQVESALRESLHTDLDNWVSTAGRGHRPDGVTTEVATGHLVATVLDRISEHDFDLLAVTGHPDDPAARAVIARLQRKSPVPVWVLRPDRSRKRRILAAVDVDRDHHGLDHRILAAANWLARPGDEIHVVAAWELIGEATLRASPFLETPEAEISRLRAECETRVVDEVAALVAEHPAADGVEVHVHVRNGRPADVIVDEVGHAAINQIVIGTIARHGIPGFVIGNTAEQLLTEVACSEFVVKPPLGT